MNENDTTIQNGKFKRMPKHVPEFWTMQDGDEMLLGIAFIGTVEYDRRDSKHLARMLDRAASFVRQQA